MQKTNTKKKTKFFSDFKYSLKALNLVWLTSKNLTILFGLFTIISGILPALIAYIGKLIIDAVMLAQKTGLESDQSLALYYLLIEAII